MTASNDTLPNSDTTVSAAKSPSKMVAFVLKHKMVFSLLFLLTVVFLWALIKMSLMNHQFEKQSAELKLRYESRIDSLTTQQRMLTTKVFSWAVRSELSRDNKEQVNQFFLNLIKEPSVLKVKYVDAKSAQITLSTDKKDEGMPYANQAALFTDQTSHSQIDSTLQIISPVMGLNSKIGVLVIDFSTKK